MTNRPMKAAVICTVIAILTTAMAACAPAATASPATPAAIVSPAPPTAEQVTPPQAADPDAGTLLTWQQGIPDTGCSRMAVTTAYSLSVGPCGQAPTRTSIIQQADALLLLSWASTNLAPFQELQTDGVGLVFKGTGTVTDAAWQHAVATWAEFTFAQETTGKVCAACQTALRWTLSPAAGQPDVCRNLTVLNFGVAYAETGPCDGSQSTISRRGLVPRADWDEFSGWLTTYQAHIDGANTFAGAGSTASLPDVSGWAERVYEAVTAGGSN